MAKAKKKNNKRKPKATQQQGSEQTQGLSLAEIETLEKAEASLETGLRPFRSGDFITARNEFAAAAADEKNSSDVQQRASELKAATLPEPTAVKAGLICASFLLLIMVVTSVLQP